MKISSTGITLLTVTLLFFAGTASAYTFGLEEATFYALRNSPAVKEIEERLLTATSKHEEELAMLRTLVDVSASTAVQAEKEDMISSLKLAVIKPLSFSAHSVRSVKRADLILQTAQATYKTQMSNALLEIKNAYYSLFKAQEFSRLAEARLNEGREKVEIEQKKAERGIVSEIDLLQAKIELGRLEKTEIEAKNQLVLARMSLNHILGRETHAQIVVIELPESSMPFEMDRNSLIDGALTRRAEVIEAANSLELEQLALKELASQRSPSFAVYGAYQTEDTEARLSLDSRLNAVGEVSYSPQTRSAPEHSNEGWRAGITLTWNLFDGGTLNERIQQKQSSVRQAEITLQRTKNSIVIEVESFLMAIRGKRKTFGAGEAATGPSKKGV